MAMRMLEPSEISQTVLCTDLSPKDVETLAAAGRKASFAVGETLVSPDDREYSLLLLLSGECEVLGVMDTDLNVLQPGMLLGEVAFVDRGARSARVVAKTPCVVAIFPGDMLENLRRENPELAARFTLNLAKILCRKLRQASRMIEAIQI
jgi:CRP-like cAMP-binding protein